MHDSDVILSIGGHKVKDVYTYMDALSKYKAGQEVVVVVKREGEMVELKVKLEPAAPELSLRAVADCLNEATEGVDVCLTKLPLGWPGGARHFSHPLDYLGGDGGAGVGAGPGITVGAALALLACVAAHQMHRGIAT